MKKLFLSLGIVAMGLLSAQEHLYRAEPEQVNNLVHTKLKVSFDFEKEHMPGEAWITLSPHFYPTDSLTLDAKGMLIHAVEMNGKKLKYDYNQELLKIDLGKTFTKDQEYTLYIKYTARPNEVKQEGSAAITDAKGLYFIDPRDEDPEKPTQIWTQGETESSSCWFPTIDKPNQKTTEEIYITVPKKFVTLSNGTLVSQKENKDGTRTDYWKQTQKHAPYLFYMGIGDFAVIEDKWKSIPVDYYVEHEYEPFAQEIFGMTPDMITFFSDRFGYEYPWDKYAQMVCRDYVSGAMENTTAVIHGETAQQKHGQLVDENVWEDVIAHELAHHWFGDLVTTESWSNLSLNESFANYSEYLWREHRYGKDHADAHRYKDIEGYLFNGANFDKHLIRFHYKSREDMFDGVSYNKGGYILHMLRSYLGDEAFFESLTLYLKKYEYGKAEAHQLRLAFEEVSGKDLNWFFNQWYFGNGHPKLKADYVYENNQVTVKLTQTQDTPLFEFPLAIDIYENGKKQRKQVWVKKEKTNTFTFETNGKAELVIVNANHDLLCELEEEKTNEQWAKQYQYATDEYTSRMLAIEGLAANQLTDDTALQTLTNALQDPYFGLREKALESLDFTSDKVLNSALATVEKMAKKDPKNLVKAAATEVLAELNDNKYKGLFENALQSESFAMQSAAINGLMPLDQQAVLEKAAGFDDEVIAGSPELLGKMIPIWKTNNDTSKFDLLTEMAAFHTFIGFQKPELAQPAEEAFNWMMESDSPSATKQITGLYKQAYNQIKDSQPQAIPILIQMAKKGLQLKSDAYKTTPTKSLEEQVMMIKDVIDTMK